MSTKADEFETHKAWFAIFIDYALPFVATLPADAHPIAVVNKMAATSVTQARQGLAMAIGDLLEDTTQMPSEQAEQLETHFAAAGLPSLASMRLRFQRKIRGILKRGVVRNEVEYYALRNAADGAPTEAERERIWALLAAFEERIVGRSGA